MNVVHILDWLMPVLIPSVWAVFKRAGKIVRSLDAVSARLDSFDRRITTLETFYKKAA